jgi:hypothetical protein
MPSPNLDAGHSFRAAAFTEPRSPSSTTTASSRPGGQAPTDRTCPSEPGLSEAPEGPLTAWAGRHALAGRVPAGKLPSERPLALHIARGRQFVTASCEGPDTREHAGVFASGVSSNPRDKGLSGPSGKPYHCRPRVPRGVKSSAAGCDSSTNALAADNESGASTDPPWTGEALRTLPATSQPRARSGRGLTTQTERGVSFKGGGG